MTAADALAEIAGRAEAAPIGEWYVDKDGSVWVDHSEGERHSMSGLTGEFPRWADGAAEFIAAARTDVPRLVAALVAALGLHVPVSVAGFPGGSDCYECGLGEQTYPCPTVTAITAALAGEGE